MSNLKIWYGGVRRRVWRADEVASARAARLGGWCTGMLVVERVYYLFMGGN